MAYKADQGRMMRMAAFWSLALLLFYGCVSLHSTLVTTFTSLGKSLIPGMERLPILGVKPNPALIISGLVLGGGLFLLRRWESSPKVSDLLIETESELRKVTWPTLDEAIDGSLVVIATVVFLMTSLAGTDYVLGELARRFLVS